MQTNETTTATLETTTQAPVASEQTPAPVSTPTQNTQAAAKRVRAKRAKQSKPATTTAKPVSAKPAKPTQAAREAAQRAQADARSLARAAAAKAVSEFYAGSSKPFKAASDRFADLNPANGKAASPRQAGLLLALITYGAGNMRRNGTFTRGAFSVPAKLINASAKPGETVKAQPESGCLGNMLGRAVDYVSGPRTGREQAQAIFRLRVPVALAEIQAAFGDKPAAAARKLLDSYAA